MAQTVSNDALWEKLSEIDKKIDTCITKQHTPASNPKQVDITSEIKTLNDKILMEIEAKANLLGTHNQSHFEANRQNIILLGESIRKILNVMSHIRKQQIVSVEQTNSKNTEQPKTENAYFNFKFFKVKKTSLIIIVLGMLVFILTAFCMKQQNDYSLLMNKYYKSITIKEQKRELKIAE
jgi:hypothetical protein